MENINLLDVVALLSDMPEEKLKKGQVGTVVEVFDAENVEVEFADKQGRTISSCAVHQSNLLKLLHEPIYA